MKALPVMQLVQERVLHRAMETRAMAAVAMAVAEMAAATVVATERICMLNGRRVAASRREAPWRLHS
jgi:hypothetical protein